MAANFELRAASRYAFSFLVAFLLMISCDNKKEHLDHADTYTCPMHPTVTSEKPGTCPICGMDLVKKARPEETVEITEDLSKLMKSPNEIVIASIKTIKGEYKSMPISIEADGIVTYDTRSIFTIPARVGGRLEKVFLKYPFQLVKKGQKVAEIYSPELLTAQRELLFVLQNDAQNESLVHAAKERLRLLGATESQIDYLVKKKEPQNTFSLYSPGDGYVVPETQQAPVAPIPTSTAPSGNAMGGGMGETSSSTQGQGSLGNSSGGNLIKEGSYVSSGQTLFKIVGNAALRVELNLPAATAGAIKKGTAATLDFGDDFEHPANVDFVQPFFNEGQEFVTIRIYTTHSDKLHIGHLVNAKLTGSSIEALWVPKEAVLDLGTSQIVFIKDKGVFKPKVVAIGTRTQDLVQIQSGISSSEEVASNAQYLVDSEGFIKMQK